MKTGNSRYPRIREALLLLPLVLLLTHCTQCTTTANQSHDTTDGEAGLIQDRFQRLFPGSYSNFAEAHSGQDAPGSIKDGHFDRSTKDDTKVIDVDIRRLMAQGDPAFLYASHVRGNDATDYTIYRMAINRKSDEVELRFSSIPPGELSLSVPEVLFAARARMQKNCNIVLQLNQGRLQGSMRMDACTFQHPDQGSEVSPGSLTLDDDGLQIETRLLHPDRSSDVRKAHLTLLRLHTYKGWMSHRPDRQANSLAPGEWRLSRTFELRDDGRINKIYNDKAQAMQYGLQLSRRFWRAGEAPYLHLSVINMANMEIQAFSWFAPGKQQLEINLKWLQTSLQQQTEEVTAP